MIAISTHRTGTPSPINTPPIIAEVYGPEDRAICIVGRKGGATRQVPAVKQDKFSLYGFLQSPQLDNHLHHNHQWNNHPSRSLQALRLVWQGAAEPVV